jgi:hypothetical protein
VIKATNLKIEKVNGIHFVTAKIAKLEYQKRFKSLPTANQVNSAVQTFEENYAGLKGSEMEPLTANKYDKVS